MYGHSELPAGDRCKSISEERDVDETPWEKILNMMCMFESVFCAQKAKAALNGADIYAGCCTLKIEYARVMLGPSLLLLLAKYLYSRLNLFHFYFI